MGNPDLDFQNLCPDFPIEREIRKRISPSRICPQGGFQLRNPNPDFMDSFLPFDWEIRKRICKTTLVNSGLLFAKYACACKTAVLKDSFSNLFLGFPNRTVKMKIQNRYLSVEIRFRISRSIAKPKSGFSKSKSRFPNRTHPKIYNNYSRSGCG